MTHSNDAADQAQAQGWLDDKPVERMKGIIWRLTGVEKVIKGQPCGRVLRCPMPKCEGWPTLKIDLGDLPNNLVVCCTRVRHNPKRLAAAVTRVTGISLGPRRLPTSSEDEVKKMRQTPEYGKLKPRAKALVDLLIEAVLVDGAPNGGISLTGNDLMAALGIRSRKWLYEAEAEAIGAGIVIRGSRAFPLGQDRGASNLWRIVCLPDDPDGRAQKRAKASAEPLYPIPKKGERKPKEQASNVQGQTRGTNREKEGQTPDQPIDNIRPDSESYAAYLPFRQSEAQRDRFQGHDGMMLPDGFPPSRAAADERPQEHDGNDFESLDPDRCFPP